MRNRGSPFTERFRTTMYSAFNIGLDSVVGPFDQDQERSNLAPVRTTTAQMTNRERHAASGHAIKPTLRGRLNGGSSPSNNESESGLPRKRNCSELAGC